MHHVRYGEDEEGNRRFELLASARHHRIAAAHVARLGLQYCATCVLITLIGMNQGLLAHHTTAFNFFDLVVLVGDDPVATQEAHTVETMISDGDGVGKSEGTVGGVGLLCQVLSADVNSDATLGNRIAHGVSLASSTMAVILA